MKKLLSLILAMIFVCSMATVAFAAGDTTVDMKTVTVTKAYRAANPGTSSPAETFRFTVLNHSVTDAAAGVTAENMPTPSVGTVSYAAGEAGSDTMRKTVTVTLPTYESVGIYTYTIQETAAASAGVEYRTSPIKLVVTVQQLGDNKVRVAAVHTEDEGGQKSDAFTDNVYSAGSLSVTKTVTGNMGDRSQYFPITVNLTGESGKDYAGNVISVGQTSYSGNPTSVTVGTPATFYLKHGETVALGNIPYGVTYTVTEPQAAGYDAPDIQFADPAKTIDTASDSVTVTNNKGAEVDTGISLDSVPFLLILAVCAGVAVLFVIKRRKIEY